MHLHTYRDESRSRHFDLVAAITSGILVVGVACALMVSFASTVPSLSAWVH
jgi:hypothetical protein